MIQKKSREGGYAQVSSRIRFSQEGGLLVKLINKTGADSVRGTLVMAYDDTAIDEAFELCSADGDECFGAVYESGVADGDFCWVVIAGIADVLLQDSTSATRGYWARTSVTTAGRADITNAAPPGADPAHFAEIGHSIESKSSGSNVLAKVLLHFL